MITKRCQICADEFEMGAYGAEYVLRPHGSRVTVLLCDDCAERLFYAIGEFLNLVREPPEL